MAESLPPTINKSLKLVGKVAAGIGIASVLTGVYWFWKNNIWRPTILVNSVMWDQGIASLQVNGKSKTLFGDTVLNAGADWGIRFAKDPDSTEPGFSRLELVKNDKVYNIIFMQ